MNSCKLKLIYKFIALFTTSVYSATLKEINAYASAVFILMTKNLLQDLALTQEPFLAKRCTFIAPTARCSALDPS